MLCSLRNFITARAFSFQSSILRTTELYWFTKKERHVAQRTGTTTHKTWRARGKADTRWKL